jgi:hypothetical protein
MPRRFRLLAGLVLAPLGASAAAAMTLAAITICPSYGCSLEIFTFAGLVGVTYGAVVGVPTALLAGLPVHHLLSITGRTHVLPYVLAGGLIGLPAAVFGLAILSRGSLNMSAEGWAFASALGASTGAISALVFWLIRRPDRDGANPDTATP